jgi:hypothetical protein
MQGCTFSPPYRRHDLRRYGLAPPKGWPPEVAQLQVGWLQCHTLISHYAAMRCCKMQPSGQLLHVQQWHQHLADCGFLVVQACKCATTLPALSVHSSSPASRDMPLPLLRCVPGPCLGCAYVRAHRKPTATARRLPKWRCVAMHDTHAACQRSLAHGARKIPPQNRRQPLGEQGSTSSVVRAMCGAVGHHQTPHVLAA